VEWWCSVLLVLHPLFHPQSQLTLVPLVPVVAALVVAVWLLVALFVDAAFSFSVLSSSLYLKSFGHRCIDSELRD
jgi:hypothetical protein